MLMQDGFSYTKSELQEGTGNQRLRDSSSSDSGSESDELYSEDLEKTQIQAKAGIKSIEHRMAFFKKHLKLLRIEQDRIVDPFRHQLMTSYGPEFKPPKMDWPDQGSSQSLLKPASSGGQTPDRRGSSFNPTKGHPTPTKAYSFGGASTRSVSAEDFTFALDKAVQKKGSEEMEKKLKQFHRIRMKKLLTIEKLTEYLETLESKQQQRLMEEHRSSFRKFKYAGPSREGPLFCLREKYRRERKAWRVKYAKKYGLYCRQVRLEKRLMRKAKRLMLREQILNVLKEKSRSKLIVLLEMRHEFKKLVEKLRLNKEIQEKIKRQDRLNKNAEKEKPSETPAMKKLPRREKNKSRTVGPTEAGETQKSPQPILNVPWVSSSVSEISTLSPLPSVPSSSTPSGTLPQINDRSKKMVHTPTMNRINRLPKIDKPGKYMRCPPLIHDKKLGAANNQVKRSSTSEETSRFSTSAAKFGPRAKVARSTRWELPLINEMKYGAAPSEELQTPNDDGTGIKGVDKSHRQQKKESLKELFKKEEEIESLLQTGKKSASDGTKLRGGRHFFTEGKTRKTKECEPTQTIKKIPHEAPQGKQTSTFMTSGFSGKIIPQRILPGGLIRSSDIGRVPRYKYKQHECKWLSLFSSMSRKLLDDDLKTVFGHQRSEAFFDSVLLDLRKTCEFIFDHLHLLPRAEVFNIVQNMVKFRSDPRFETFKRICLNYMGTVDPINYKGTRRLSLKEDSDIIFDRLKKGFNEFEAEQIQKKKDYRADKSKRGRSKKMPDESKVIRKKRKRRLLADKLLLQRGHQFRNPVRVTTKLGGKLMLQGWKTLSFDEYINLGSKLEVAKSGWRKDGMEHYEVIAPLVPEKDLKYLLVLNRLDLTPRRFEFLGYKYNSNIVRLFKYCSSFYRAYMLKRGDRKTERGKQRVSFQETHGRARLIFGSTLLQGEFCVPHLRQIFTRPSCTLDRPMPKDRHTPLMFSKRNEFDDDDDDPKKLRIVLQETETLELWSFKSTVALRGTVEAKQYGKDQRRMKKYFDRFHRTFGRETQTELVNYIDRTTQADAPVRDSKKTNVYETEIMKAGTELPPPKIKPIKQPGFQEDDESDPSELSSVSSVESLPDCNTKIMTSSEFMSRIKLTLRIMDSMLYSENQLTFREGLRIDPSDPKAEVTYSHERLFSFIDKRIALSEYIVTCMDWSSVNPNLLAIGYSRHPLYPEQDKGMICIWNVKMITKYERKFEFKNGVTYLQFCIPYPRLLNVALLDGSVLILDLGAKKNIVVTTKLSSVFSDYKPVWQFSWIEVEKEKFIPITCGDNGLIHQLRPDGTFQHSKFLSLGHREGKVKGINLSSSMGLKPRIRGRPGITCLEKHPTDPVLYLVGTSDGCVHICSVYFRNQHLDVFSAHIGAVKGIKFHPHCEHVFLTYGEDFYVRVWLYGTFEPALELMAGNYYVRAAQWSPANPEILVSISDKYVDVWDIRRKTDSPIHRFMNPRQIENTALIFDRTGYNIVLGDICGDVYIYALKNMPFSHYFKGEAIASALEKVLKAKKKFVRDIRKLGYPFGASKSQAV